jgi:SPP1 family predicted phage head-tail adaptor
MALQYDYVGRKSRFSTDPGRLDRRVTLQWAYKTRDDMGGETVTWINAADVWASKRFESGRRMYAAEEKQGEDFLVYRIRHRLDVGRFWRLQHGDDVFEIVAVEELGRRHFLDLTVRGINQSVGASLSVLLLHDTGGVNFLTMHDTAATPVLLHAAA